MTAGRNHPPWSRLGSIEHDGQRPHIVRTVYNDDRIALFLTTVDGQLFSRLTFHLPDESLEPDEVAVRTGHENANLRMHLLATGIFVDTGRRLVGPVSEELEVWRLDRMTPTGLTTVERGELERWLRWPIR